MGLIFLKYNPSLGNIVAIVICGSLLIVTYCFCEKFQNLFLRQKLSSKIDKRPMAVVLMGAELNKLSLLYIFAFHVLFQNSKNAWNAFANQHT